MDKRLSLLAALALAACDQPGGRATSQVGDATTTTTTTTTTAPDATTASDATATPDTGTGDTAVAPDTGGAPRVVDPACIDGQLAETPPDDAADIQALVQGYTPSGYLAFVDAVLAARYPVGRYLVATAVAEGTSFGNCIEMFTSSRASPTGIFSDLSTVVHECGHIADMSRSGFSSSVFLVNEDVDFECSSAAARSGETFARSLLNGDDYSALYPDDFYKDVYLDGDPTNGGFEGGDQGYDSVLEETTQYVNSLVTDWAFRDQRARGSSVSARDGILTFLWYVERYLHLARLEHPDTYALITHNACWREATLTIWGRAWRYLELTDGEPGLGIDDDVVMDLVMDETLLGEIELLREAAGCR